MSRHFNAQLRHRIGVRIRELREAAGITSQEALAHKAGVHRTYVGRLERGESGVTVEALAAIAGAMEVTLSEFFHPFTELIPLRTPRKRG